MSALEADRFAYYELSFADASGRQRRESLASAWRRRFEDVQQVRGFPVFKGQKHFSGLWWSVTSGCHVGFESWVERDQAMMLDFDPRVVAFASQPFRLSWADYGQKRRHVPDFFARLSDGTGVVIDVRPDDLLREQDTAVFAQTKAACDQVGWHYRRLGALDPLLAANLRWIAGYRHPRFFRRDVAAHLMQAFSAPTCLFEGAERVGDRLAVLPVLYHLLWRRVLRAEMETSRLNGRSLVRWERT